MSKKLDIIKETMEFLKLNDRIDLDRLFKDANINSTIVNLISLWYNVHSDPGLSEMILKEISKNYELAKKD